MKPPKQLELSGIPRRRAIFVDHDEAEPSVAIPQEALFAKIGYSPWTFVSVAEPPVSGEWEVRDVARKLATVRAIYSKEQGTWILPHWPFPLDFHGEWRGLAAPYPDGILIAERLPAPDIGVFQRRAAFS